MLAQLGDGLIMLKPRRALQLWIFKMIDFAIRQQSLALRRSFGSGASILRLTFQHTKLSSWRPMALSTIFCLKSEAASSIFLWPKIECFRQWAHCAFVRLLREWATPRCLDGKTAAVPWNAVTKGIS